MRATKSSEGKQTSSLFAVLVPSDVIFRNENQFELLNRRKREARHVFFVYGADTGMDFIKKRKGHCEHMSYDGKTIRKGQCIVSRTTT